MDNQFISQLSKRAKSLGHGICMGMDPVLEKIPLEGKPEEKIRKFYEESLNAMVKKNAMPVAVKPNIAFYEAISIDCLFVLKDLISLYQKEGVLVVLDAKRGDIGKTSAAYAKMAFDVYAADAVTLAPYMGLDSIEPFQKNYPEKGMYVLVRTSNPSAEDFQNQNMGIKKLYQVVAQKLIQWNKGNLGAVVGATAPSELTELVSMWVSQGFEVPCLIPGVSMPGVSGGQGASLGQTLKAIQDGGGDASRHLINLSSGLNYAYEKYPELSFGEASATALLSLAEEFKGYL